MADKSFFEPLVNPQVLERVKQWRAYIEAKLGFRNHWYPAMFAEEVAEGQPVTIKLLGENLILNRVDGKVYCLKDRCLHRGVPLSRKIECYTKDTITCWYHAWTYRWDDGSLCDILTDPSSRMIGTRKLKSYKVEEAKGIIFVFVGDIEPPPLKEDVPPEFLDEDMAIRGHRRQVNSNWRLGAENGFDSTHVFIHKNSILISGNETTLPLGFAPKPGHDKNLWTTSLESGGPKGVYDNIGAHSQPVFSGTIHGEVVCEAIRGGDKRLAHQISIWMPGVLKVDPFPDPTLKQFEWYVPRDETSHWYFQTIGCRVANEEEERRYDHEFHTRWKPLGLHGFNDDDVWAREATQPFYEDDWGWIEEQLFEADGNIIAWRKLSSEHNRGIQTKLHL